MCLPFADRSHSLQSPATLTAIYVCLSKLLSDTCPHRMKAISTVTTYLARARTLRYLRPYDTSTPEGRANERHRRAALTAVAAVLARCLSIATALITVPLTLHYLGTERYGMWMTMSSLVAMLSFADLGIGNGVLNAVAAAYGGDDFAAIKEYVSSGIFVLSAIAASLLLLFFAVYTFVPWYEIFNVNSMQARQDAGPSLAVLVACFAFSIPLGVVQRVQMGLQKGFLANLWQCLSSLLTLGCVLFAVYTQVGLPWLVLAFAGSPLLASLLNSLLFFGWLQSDALPSPKYVSRTAMHRVAHIGILFFVLQIVGAVSYTSDNIVIAQILGANAVAAYTVPQRLFSVIPMIIMMALSPLWPAYGEAMARGDGDWIRKTVVRSLVLSTCFAGTISAVLVVFGPHIMRLWVGNVVMPTFSLLLGLGIWQVIQAAGNAIAMLLNGTNVVKFQVIVATITGAVTIGLKIVMVKDIGISGAVWSCVIANLVCATIPLYRKVSSIVVRR